MKSLPTVTIGIPAFNEQENIGSLLDSLLVQEQDGWHLEAIIVMSDGSTDSTEHIVTTYADEHQIIRLFHREARKGISQTQNDILEKTTSDFLVLMDADVSPADSQVLNNLLTPALSGKVALTGGCPLPITPTSFFEKIMAVSEKFKRTLAVRISGTNKMLLCHGRIRGFHRSLYSKIIWPENVPEDSYSYLFCIDQGQSFYYAPKAIVYFHVPQHLSDYQKQHKRFASSQTFLKKLFPDSFVSSHFSLPKIPVLTTIAEFFVKHPFLFSAYIVIYLYVRHNSSAENEHSLASIAVSTKRKIQRGDHA